jgi:hypothetical protein
MIRRVRLTAALLVGGLASAGVAAAQPSPYGAGETRTGPEPTPATRAPGAPEPLAPAAPRAPDPFAPAVPPSTGQPLPAPEPGSVMRRPEQLSHKPSGFWTSNRPAKGGAYRWRIMGMGALVLAIAVFFVVRMLRRVSRQRALGETDAR